MVEPKILGPLQAQQHPITKDKQFCKPKGLNIPRHSMHAIYAYIDPQNSRNVGIYGIHGVSGIYSLLWHRPSLGHSRSRLQETPVGQIQGGCVVWHPLEPRALGP